MRLLTAGAVAAALLCAPAAALGSPSIVTAIGKMDVAPGAPTPMTVRCPSKSMAVSGYATGRSSTVSVRDSVPRALNSWSFTHTATAPGSVVVAVRCLRVRTPRGAVNVRTGVATNRSRIAVPANGSRATRVSCPRGYLPTGYGVDRSESGAGADRVLLAAAVPDARSWSFRLENTGGAQRVASIRLRCVTATARGTLRGRTIRQTFSISRPGFSNSVSGERALARSCARSHASLATGFSVRAADDVSVPLAFPTGIRGGRWRVRNPSGAPERVRTHLSCLSLRTRFR